MIGFNLPLRIWRWFWWKTWMVSEAFGFSLGRFAPWVFAQMIGATSYKKVDEDRMFPHE